MINLLYLHCLMYGGHDMQLLTPWNVDSEA